MAEKKSKKQQPKEGEKINSEQLEKNASVVEEGIEKADSGRTNAKQVYDCLETMPMTELMAFFEAARELDQYYENVIQIAGIRERQEAIERRGKIHGMYEIIMNEIEKRLRNVKVTQKD